MCNKLVFRCQSSQTIGNPHQGLLVEILQFADFCPVLLLALLAGVISDRVNRKVWLITLQALACALGAGLAVAAFLGRATPWVVITFTFLEGIVWALNGPVFLSVVPSLVPRAELGPALALNSVQFNMARLCGPMLAAALIGAIGVAGAFTFNACTFLPLLIALLLAISWTGLLFVFVASACPFADWFAGSPLQSGSPAPDSSHPAPAPIPEPEPHSLPTTSWPP